MALEDARSACRWQLVRRKCSCRNRDIILRWNPPRSQKGRIEVVDGFVWVGWDGMASLNVRCTSNDSGNVQDTDRATARPGPSCSVSRSSPAVRAHKHLT